MKKLSCSEIPSSVYRLQLNADFPLKKAIAILPYLKRLGVEGVYCSPYYDAYSAHGYDVTDPNALNPQIGTPREYAHFCSEMKRLELRHIIDVVPNHMGIKGGKNIWWQDVLEKGPHSPYALFFDIDWNPEKAELKNRILLPILGCSYGEALDNGEIQLSYKEGRYTFHYGDYPLPVAAHSYPILENYGESAEKIVAHVNKDANLLDRLLEKQYYRLAYWKVASHEINYRRFFNIHELVAIRIEEKKVFDIHHRWLFDLIDRGDVQGLRIDHPDGLYDPVAYFKALRSRCPIFTVVEKILDRKESLPSTWQVEGTVGYEAINLFNGLFVRQQNGDIFTAIYEEFIGEKHDFDEILYASKRLFATHEMASEVDALGLHLDRLSEQNRHYRDFTRTDLTQALTEVIAAFPVYRTYIGPKGEASKRDAAYITAAIRKARKRARDLDPSIFDFLEKLLLVKIRGRGYREFVLRFQQLTGPMMAKGLEDTAFYRYNRFISLNEVGGEPRHFGCSIDDFHQFNRKKKERWPYGLLASSTHDTKRSEDVRMRLNVLSEIPERWREEVKEWAAINVKHKGIGPSANAEYFIYQTLVGVWPQKGVSTEELPSFFERLWKVILKSIREAKEETSWHCVDESYEQSVYAFLSAILREREFLERFLPFHAKIDRLGALNSLSATALKFGSCGVVDLYQGNETFTYRLVDPDNRIPIDFVTLENAFASDEAKFQLQHTLLNFRKEHPEVFLDGEYLPLKARGAGKEHLIAFMRRTEKISLIVLATRFFTSLTPEIWRETQLILPEAWGGVDLLTEKQIHTKKQGSQWLLPLEELLEAFPVSYIYGRTA